MALFLTLGNPAAKPYKHYGFAKQCKVFFKRGTSPNKLIIKALQYPLFCNAKEPVLRCNIGSFAKWKYHSCQLIKFSLQN